MRSARPKVLHEVAGLPMVAYPVQAALDAGAWPIVVVPGRGADRVEAFLRARFGDRVAFARQAEPRGTADAVRAALPLLRTHRGRVLVVYGDTPLLRSKDLRALVHATARARAPIGFLTFAAENPSGYGRVVRDAKGRVAAIREEKDCTTRERAIDEVNAGVYVVNADVLRRHVGRIGAANRAREFYLTDLVAFAARGRGAIAVRGDEKSLRGVNDRAQLAEADEEMREAIAARWLHRGVTLRDPERVEIGADARIGRDTVIEMGAVLAGRTIVGRGCTIGHGAILRDSVVRDGAVIRPYCVLAASDVGPGAIVGPFAHLRPGTVLAAGARVGNFVETKNTRLGKGSKANHLAYLGDGVVGSGVNVGAGTIFCNYDGFRKHLTTIEDGVFVGSNASLVAPLRIGAGAYVGTGSIVTRDVPRGALAIARARQENKEGYAEKLRGILAARRGVSTGAAPAAWAPAAKAAATPEKAGAAARTERKETTAPGPRRPRGREIPRRSRSRRAARRSRARS